MESLVGKQVKLIVDECSVGPGGHHCRCSKYDEKCCFCHQPANATYTVVQSISEDKVMIVDDPTDPKVIDNLPVSLLEVVDE